VQDVPRSDPEVGADQQCDAEPHREETRDELQRARLPSGPVGEVRAGLAAARSRARWTGRVEAAR
jgi:hypothetical protein